VCLIGVAVAGDMLLAKKHKASREIRAQLEQLLTVWRQLLQESNNRGRGLEEAQDILEFNNQAEKVEAWIRDKVRLIGLVDTFRYVLISEELPLV
jgi:spectrin beta